MKRIWLAATLAGAGLAFGAGQDLSQAERARRILDRSCTTCHEIRTIQTQALDDAGWGQVLLNTCTLCHDLERVKRHSGSREDWEETLIAMLNEGAPLSDQEFAVVLGYLARYFRP
jgi:cytochrome c2